MRGPQRGIVARAVQRQRALRLREVVAEGRIGGDVYRYLVRAPDVQAVAHALHASALRARFHHAVVLHAAVGRAALHQQAVAAHDARARVVGAAHHVHVQRQRAGLFALKVDRYHARERAGQVFARHAHAVQPEAHARHALAHVQLAAIVAHLAPALKAQKQRAQRQVRPRIARGARHARLYGHGGLVQPALTQQLARAAKRLARGGIDPLLGRAAVQRVVVQVYLILFYAAIYHAAHAAVAYGQRLLPFARRPGVPYQILSAHFCLHK